MLTRVPDVAQADNSVHRTTAASNPLWIRFMIGTFLINGIGYSDLWINAGDRSIFHDLTSFPIGRLTSIWTTFPPHVSRRP